MTHPPAPARTAAGAVFRNVRERFREGRARVGPERWWAWWRDIGIGVALMAALTVGLVLIARRAAATGALDGEADFLISLGENGPLPFYAAVFFQTIATDITLYILIAFTAGIAAWSRRPITAMSIIAAFVGTDLVVRFGWLLWDRERPDVLHQGLASPGLHAFPSGHTAKAAAVYGLLAILWIRASGSVLERTLALLVLAFIVIVVPLGRMTMGVHWPSDVAGGWILGFAWLAILARSLRHERR